MHLEAVTFRIGYAKIMNVGSSFSNCRRLHSFFMGRVIVSTLTVTNQIESYLLNSGSHEDGLVWHGMV